MAAQRVGEKISKVEHLTITPDTLGQALGRVIRGEPS